MQYVTGFYFKKPGFFARILDFVPASLRKRLERELLRRRNSNLDDNLVAIFPFPELFFYFSMRFKFLRRFASQIIWWRNHFFDKKVAIIAASKAPGAVICYDSCALNTFRACREKGIIAVLDQTIGHITSGVKILEEESRLQPEFADTLVVDSSDRLIKLCVEEALAADKILVASEYVKESLIRIGVANDKIFVNPYGVDTQRFFPAQKAITGIFRILFVGAIGQRKGIKYLLEAFKRLNLPDAELLLVGGILGSGIGLQPYEGLFKHITNIPHHEVHTVFQNADLFVYPSLHEGSALGIYEAMASGLPVITTPNAGSIVRDGKDGFIVPIRNIEALMEKILLLHQNKELRDEMGRQARKRAESFTWKAYYERLSSLVENFTTGRDK